MSSDIVDICGFESCLSSFVEERYPDSDPVGKVIRYILEGRGKRVRPRLCFLSCEVVGGDPRLALAASLAIEIVHAYSLVHDDLPCMDNDELRRGRPTAHVEFDEASAVLAGDGLLTDAFSVLSDEGFVSFTKDCKLNSGQRLALVKELASAAGSFGMVGGQGLDAHHTKESNATREDLDELHLKKTGRLIGAACAMGAICANASTRQVEDLRKFGHLIGLAFQIIDDLLDQKDGTGKSKGKDEASGKLTYLSTMTFEEASKVAENYTDQALAILQSFGGSSEKLQKYSLGLLRRER